MVYSIIKKSEIEGALRLDAEYYQPEYFIDFTNGKWRPIGEFLETCQYGLSKAMNTEIGNPIFRMNDIKNAFLVNNKLKFIDIPIELFNQYKLEKNDVLFNRVNSEEFVGRTGIFKLDGDFTFASYLIRLKTKEQAKVLPDYLNIFLNSSFGKKQIRKFSRRAVNQANVNAEELKKIKIKVLPLEFQKEVEKISNEVWDNNRLSEKLYSQAENFLLEELGLKDFEFSNDLYNIVNFSDIKTANRIDAEYFQVKYEELLKKINKNNAKLLLEATENIGAKFNARSQPEQVFKYIALSNISSSLGVVNNYSEILGKDTPSRAKRILQEGDVIISTVEGSLGKVALVSKEQQGYLASTGFFQFRSKKILPEVLLVLAKSIVLQMQLEKQTAGTILTAVPKESLNYIIVPILSKATQQKIADLVRKSHQARKKAEQLLEEAKQKVEDSIEK